MKVLFVVGGLPFGGIENLLFDLSLNLRKRNVEFKIVNLSGTGEKTEEFLQAQLPVVKLGKSKKDIKTYRVKTTLKLRKLIKDYQPSIIHSMQFSGDYFSRVASISLDGFKIITHIHSIKREARAERRLINKVLSYKTDVFLSVSKEVFNIVEREHNIAKRPHYVLYNAINPERLKGEDKPELEKGKEYIVCVGRLVKQKNFDVAVRAFSLIEKSFPNLRLIIVGEGKEREKLTALVKKLKIERKVIFTGYRKNVFPILKSSHLFLMPSSYEGFGIAHLEAMYAGLPAVISPYVPSKEIAYDCSLIVPIKPREIANAISKLLSDNSLYKQFSQKAKEIAQQFTIDRYTDKLLNFYKSVLSGELPERIVL